MKLLPLFVCSAVFIASASSQCDISPSGTEDPNPPVDAWSALTPIGFAFPFQGTTYTSLYYSDHGLLALGDGGSAGAPASGVPTFDAGLSAAALLSRDLIACYWGDHGFSQGSPGLDGIHVDSSSATSLRISWIGLHPFFSGMDSRESCSVTLYDTGEIEMSYGANCRNRLWTPGFATIVGILPTPVATPTGADLSASPTVATPSCFEEFVGAGFNLPDRNYDLTGSTLHFAPQVGGGWQVAWIDDQCAEAASIGTGCGFALDANSRPVIGTSWSMQMRQWTSTGQPIFVAYGSQLATPDPVGLTFPALFGSGCEAYTDAGLGAVAYGTNAGPEATLTLPIPNNNALAGLEMVAQGLSFMAASGAEIRLTNGLLGRIGF